jgi:hypothetical protein
MTNTTATQRRTENAAYASLININGVAKNGIINWTAIDRRQGIELDLRTGVVSMVDYLPAGDEDLAVNKWGDVLPCVDDDVARFFFQCPQPATKVRSALRHCRADFGRLLSTDTTQVQKDAAVERIGSHIGDYLQSDSWAEGAHHGLCEQTRNRCIWAIARLAGVTGELADELTPSFQLTHTSTGATVDSSEVAFDGDNPGAWVQSAHTLLMTRAAASL